VISLDDAPQGFRESDAGAPRRFVLDPRRMLRRWSGRDPRPSERTAPTVAGQVAVCLVAGLALTGCGAGQIAQTATQQAAVDGASGDAGDDIALRGVLMPSSPNPSGSYPVGSNVPVLATIINSGGEADELVAVTSPMAGRVQVSGTVRIPPRRNIVSDTDPSAPRSPLVAGKLQIVVVTTHVLRPGLDTPMTFQFRNAGQVTLPVPQAEPAQGTGSAGRRDQEG
jgi:periplasmic copper chaperone A